MTNNEDGFKLVEAGRTNKRKVREDQGQGYECDSSTSTVQSMVVEHTREERPLLIVVRSLGNNWRILLSALKSQNCFHEAKFVRQRLHILWLTVLLFRVRQKELLMQGLDFHTFCLKEVDEDLGSGERSLALHNTGRNQA